MKIEEAIEWMEEAIQETTECFEECSPSLQKELIEQKEVFELAITALRSTSGAGEYHLRDGTKMVPLSLEQLKQMNGKPVWGKSLINEKPGEWFILRVVNMSKTWFIACAGAEQGFGDKDTYGKTWLAYPYPPAHIDRSKWEPCEHCKSAEYPPKKFGAHEFPVVGNEIYFYDTEYGWEGEEIKYCPWCGRPLTEEAWAELERRVRG